jgi:protein-S-isoprenylcysteine O-methyltransferase Ste14
VIFIYAKPVSASNSNMFITPVVMNYVISGLAALLFLTSQIQLGVDIFSPYPLSAILGAQFIEVEEYGKAAEVGLVSNGVYGLCRHPMQASVILLLLFSSNIYTVDRLIFIVVNCAGIFMGVFYE